jgi:hypothetical protein
VPVEVPGDSGVDSYVVEAHTQDMTQTTTQDPTGQDATVVETVPKNANFEMGWDGFKFYTLKDGRYVAVAKVAR